MYTPLHPTVSVIIPTYNRERYLQEAVDSVLAQTYSPIEILVVDDGSTDGTAAVVSQLKNTLRYIDLPHNGVSHARNQGVAESKGELLAFLDSDDLWMDTKIEAQVQALEHDLELEAVFTHVRQYFSPDLPETERNPHKDDHKPVPGLIPSAMLIRREAFLRIGPFEEGLEVGEFMSWYMRANEKSLRIRVLPDCLCLRRIHSENKGRITQQSVAARARIIKAALDRRRQGR